MLKNYITIAFRNIRKNKFISFVNIFSLTVGISVATLIMLWVMDELNYDKFYTDCDRLYIVETLLGKENKEVIWSATPDGLGDEIKNDFPEIESVVKLDDAYAVSLSVNNNAFIGDNFYYATPNILDVFNIELVSGNSNTAFADPLSIVITEDNSNKLFGTLNSIGRKILLNGTHELVVTGIIKSLNRNTHLPIEYIVPYSFLDMTNKRSKDWGRYDFYTYVKVKQGISIDNLKIKLNGYLKNFKEESRAKLLLRKVKDIHLFAPYGNGNFYNVLVIAIIGAIMLLVGCINYINLTTAQATKRFKEVGVRKTIGANKKELVKQFFCESSVVIVISLFLSFILFQILLYPFNELAEKKFEYSSLFSIEMLTGIVVLVVIITTISTIYPALYLSRYNPFSILKNGSSSFFNEFRLRKTLTFIHFFVTAILLISILFIKKQMNFIKNKNLGFNTEQVLWISTRYLNDDLQAFKNKIEEWPQIKGTAIIGQLPTNMGNYTWINRWEGASGEESVMFNVMAVDDNFIPLMKIELLKGSNFGKEEVKKDGILINSEALKQTGITEPIGKQINFWGNKKEIIGVIKDFHNKSLHEKITPVIMYYHPDRRGRYFLVKISPNNVSETIARIENIYSQLGSNSPFTFSFLDEDIDKLYKGEQKIQTIFTYLTMVTIFIAIVGLLGLTIHSAERREKEIGIRKVLGASVHNLAFLMSKDFILIVLSATCLASPFAYYIIYNWLQNFTYKTEMDLPTFLIAGITVFFLTLATVSIQSIKVAIANPVESLRDE